MKLRLAAIMLTCAIAFPAWAALPVGAAAPTFAVQATQAGRITPFNLAEKLRRGPVVLYFFPAAFTSVCTIEAREFAARIPRFTAAGATVIGMTAGATNRLAEFSVSECRSAFAVAAASAPLMRSYDATSPRNPAMSDRTSYVIAPNGRIIFSHTGSNPVEHAAQTLAAVQTWRAANPRR